MPYMGRDRGSTLVAIHPDEMHFHRGKQPQPIAATRKMDIDIHSSTASDPDTVDVTANALAFLLMESDDHYGTCIATFRRRNFGHQPDRNRFTRVCNFVLVEAGSRIPHSTRCTARRLILSYYAASDESCIGPHTCVGSSCVGTSLDGQHRQPREGFWYH